MTQSAQPAVNMANITPWAHELRDTVADTMEEPSRDELNKVTPVQALRLKMCATLKSKLVRTLSP
jgi:hypothetical protein